MKFVPLINLKLLTSANSFLLNIAMHENFSANKYENTNYSFIFISRENFDHAQLSLARNKALEPQCQIRLPRIFLWRSRKAIKAFDLPQIPHHCSSPASSLPPLMHPIPTFRAPNLPCSPHLPKILSLYTNKIHITLNPWELITLTSAGTLSPNLMSTISPTTISEAFRFSFSPLRITRPYCKRKKKQQTYDTYLTLKALIKSKAGDTLLF